MQRGLTFAAFTLLGAVACGQLDLHLYQRAQNLRLLSLLADRSGETARRARVGSQRARAEAAATGLVGRIEIPRLGLSAIVAEGGDEQTLARAVGHLPGTAFPGDAGNVGLAGHRDSFFQALEKIQQNDQVRVLTPDGTFEYRVETISIVEPERTDLLRPTRSPSLTLVTCYPFRYVGSAPQRFVVQAREVPPQKGPES